LPVELLIITSFAVDVLTEVVEHGITDCLYHFCVRVSVELSLVTLTTSVEASMFYSMSGICTVRLNV
jgi:hypothetical protein